MNTSAQNYVKIQAHILQKVDSKPIPFAHCKILGSTYGSVANAEGLIELAIPNRYLNDTLKLSAIGYKTKLVPIQIIRKSQKVYLELDVISLSEVIVKYVDPAKEMIKQAVNHIPENYSSSPTMLTGFTREGAYKDSLHKHPYYQLETSTEILKENYSETNINGHVKLLKGRISKTQLNDSLWVKFYSSTHLPHRFDFVMQRSGILNIKKLDRYDVEIIDTLRMDGISLFKLAYRKIEDHDTFNNFLYIQDGSFAIAKIEQKWQGRKNENPLNIAGPKYYRIKNNQTITYQALDDIWHLNSIRYETTFEGEKSKLKTLIKVDYITTQVKKAENSEIPYEERLLYREITYDEVEKIDTTFWTDKSILVLPEASTNLFLKNSDIPISNKSSTIDKKMAVIAKFASSMNIGIRNYAVDQKNISYEDDNITLSDSTSNLSSIPFFINSGFQYKFDNNFLMDFNLQSSFKNKQYTAVQLGAVYRIQMNKKGRPFFSTVGLGLGHSWYNNKLQSITLEESIRMNNKKFNSEALELYYGIREWSITPNYTLGMEVNSWFELQLKIDYFLPLQRSEGFYFREEDGLIRNSTYIKQNSHTLNPFEKPQLSNIGIGLGLRFSF